MEASFPERVLKGGQEAIAAKPRLLPGVCPKLIEIIETEYEQEINETCT
jgi:hypothetical protein